MRSLMMAAGALALLGSTAMAEDVIVAPTPGAVIEHRGAADEGATTTTKTITHNEGCASKSVTHTNEDTGSSVTHTRSDC